MNLRYTMICLHLRNMIKKKLRKYQLSYHLKIIILCSVKHNLESLMQIESVQQ
uniref:DDE_Tnp_1_7 domain-containing protein n=1 Tax=Strongyloides papillosus TaxID=174720 RepID=A0A0N5BC24_STREA